MQAATERQNNVYIWTDLSSAWATDFTGLHMCWRAKDAEIPHRHVFLFL